MIVDRYDPINLFELVPKLRLEFEPELAQLDQLLDDDELFWLVKADLMKRYPNSGRLGRHSTPVEVILRMLVVKRLYGWSYQQTERFVNDSIVLRQRQEGGHTARGPASERSANEEAKRVRKATMVQAGFRVQNGR
jgi:transposase, IS5 family